jgi:LytS/YehU family sensor histidine kinase
MWNLIKKVIQNRIFLHSLFWIISFFILLQHFSISSEVSLIDYIFTALFHVSIITSVYINLYLLIPKLLDKQHYLVYIISLAALFVLFYGLHVFTFDILSEIIFPDYYLITFYSYVELLKYFVIYIGLTTLFMLSKYWFELLESKKKLAETEKEKIQNELKALKAQVNPHFLFNSLNTIYSLALKKSEETPSVILKLSDVLRYMIYESNEKLVDLKSEVEFIYNYIDLQKLRIQNPESIKFYVQGQVANQKIAPLILVVFIENAFKHGIKGDVELQFIRIRLNVTQNEIEFEIENNRGTSEELGGSKFKGLGLENVKRRLELMYPGKHELEISNNHDKFMIHMILQL